MSAETETIQIPEKVMQQIRSDCQLAIQRTRLAPSGSDTIQLRCVDFRRETDDAFGAQLWYFDGHATDAERRRVALFGALEYSIQFGLHELVDHGVFDSVVQRDRFHSVYQRGHFRGTLSHPVHRWLLVGTLLVAIAIFVRLLFLLLAA